jgi:superfamily II DNA or RNA helicase
MPYYKETVRHSVTKWTDYDQKLYNKVWKERWNPWKGCPVQEIGELCHLVRKVVNSHPSRLVRLIELIEEHEKVIVFYNFDYELEIIRQLSNVRDLGYAEWNGHKHEDIPKTDRWVYVCQYIAGAEGWNCIETNTIIFWSLTYSYKLWEQAHGRIDRINTPFTDLYYYTLRSKSVIDASVWRSLKAKKSFQSRELISDLTKNG